MKELWIQHGRVVKRVCQIKLKISSHSFTTDAARVWNLAPDEIRTATTLADVKSKIKKYVTSLPVQNVLIHQYRKHEDRGRWHHPCPSLLIDGTLCPSLYYYIIFSSFIQNVLSIAIQKFYPNNPYMQKCHVIRGIRVIWNCNN